MTKCILCTVDFEVSRYPRFCLACEERAISGLHMLFSRTGYLPEHLEERSMWKTPEILELAERAIMEFVRRLDGLYEEGGRSLPVLPSDPVLLVMLSVAVSAELGRLRSRVSDLLAEVERLRPERLRPELVGDLGLLVQS